MALILDVEEDEDFSFGVGEGKVVDAFDYRLDDGEGMGGRFREGAEVQ